MLPVMRTRSTDDKPPTGMESSVSYSSMKSIPVQPFQPESNKSFLDFFDSMVLTAGKPKPSKSSDVPSLRHDPTRDAFQVLGFPFARYGGFWMAAPEAVTTAATAGVGIIFRHEDDGHFHVKSIVSEDRS